MSDQDTTKASDARPIEEAPLAEVGRHYSMRERVQILEPGGTVPARDESGRMVVLDSEGCARLLAKGKWVDADAGAVFHVGEREVTLPLAGAVPMVVLTEDFVTDEAAGEMEAMESQVEVDGARRRVDRVIGLLRALPEGWRVERWDEMVADRKIGHDFRVIDARGDVRGRARRHRRVVSTETRQQTLNWGGAAAAGAGDAWAAGLALLLAAVDAEAHGDPDDL